MIRTWLGPARYLFIPLVVEDTTGYLPPPPHFRELVQRRVFFDPDPQTNEDRSLSSYISSISYGRASIDATVAQPVTVRKLGIKENPTLPAIYAQPDSHKFEYLAVVYPTNLRGQGGGMAQPGRIDYDPPRSPNRTRARSRFLHDERIGTWAMEVIHNVTNIADYYNGVSHPGRFDNLAASVATHPSAYTKLLAGWLDAGSVRLHPGHTATYKLHAIGLPHPAPAGRVAAVKLQARDSDRYLIIEARLRSDRWERGFSGSQGIPSEGVVVYEYAPDWPKLGPGAQPPLQLRTPTALTVGQSITHEDRHNPHDHRTGRGRNRTITVKSAIPGGFVIEVSSDEAQPRGGGSGGDTDDPPHDQE